MLAASYARGIDLYTVEELCDTPDRSREADGGRLPREPGAPQGHRRWWRQGPAHSWPGESARTAEMVREILNEVKTTGVGDNKNVLVELNIETTRHQEIQVIGNGHWSMCMGGRDCSLQMHEQKLLEVSVTRGIPAGGA